MLHLGNGFSDMRVIDLLHFKASIAPYYLMLCNIKKFYHSRVLVVSEAQSQENANAPLICLSLALNNLDHGDQHSKAY